jgi:type I restriction enzyme S subunit
MTSLISTVEGFFTTILNISDNQNEIEKLIVKFKSKILDLAIKGKLFPQDPTDESASILLERIR